MAHFLVVPQWQGSGSARAMQLIDGAEAIAGDLPRAATTRIDVPIEAGESLGTGIRRLSSLQRVRADIEHQVSLTSEPCIVIGGDCGVVLGAIEALDRHDDVAVLWFDAHGDLHTPETSPSGAFGGMTLRAMLGEGAPEMVLSPGISPDRVVLVGARDLDIAEADYVATKNVTMLAADDDHLAERIADCVVAAGATRLYVHVDLDVLDPSAIDGVSAPVPFGADPATVVAAVRAARERLPLAGASVTGFAPPSPDAAVADLGVILRIIGALA